MCGISTTFQCRAPAGVVSGVTALGIALAETGGMDTRAVRPGIWTGSATCPHCLQLYVEELAVRCGCCQAALCALCCVTRLGLTGRLCPDCALEVPEPAEAC
jgi:hypothetical protein